MFLVSSVVIAMRLLDPRIKGPRWLVLVTAGLIGIVLTLLGIGKLRRPAYALVFVSIPLSGWLYSQVDPNALVGISGYIAFMSAACCLTLYGVRRYYAKIESEREPD